MIAIAHLHCYALIGAAWIAAGCGGKVVLDQAQGGAGGASTSSGTGGAATTTASGAGGTVIIGGSSSSGGVECSGAYDGLESAVADAQQCDPTLQTPQCTGADVVHDECGCDVVANEANQQAFSAATAAWAGCISVGCCGPAAHPITPPSCMPCPPPPAGGACNPMTDLCVAVLPP